MENVLTVKKSAPLDRTKPLVKDFFDKDAEIANYLKVRLPEHKGVMKINPIFSSLGEDDLIKNSFRVNWMTDEKIISLFVQVFTTNDGMVVSHTAV